MQALSAKSALRRFLAPTGQSFVVADFHNTGEAAAASFHVNFSNYNQMPAALGKLQFQLFSGAPKKPDSNAFTIGDLVRGAWYDFVLGVRWSSGVDGKADGWVNGRQVMNYRGPTLYAGQQVYFKAALYHAANIPPASKVATFVPNPYAVIHDRIRMGTAQEDVA